jgi:hypothetical protein
LIRVTLFESYSQVISLLVLKLVIVVGPVGMLITNCGRSDIHNRLCRVALCPQYVVAASVVWMWRSCGLPVAYLPVK